LSDGPLFAASAGVAELRLSDFKMQELANTAWALARVQRSGVLLFAASARMVEQALDELSEQNLANIV